MKFALETEETYSKEDLEEIFNTNFGYQITGINLFNTKEGEKCIILTSKEESPYTDSIDG
ncbi:MAG: hypothetical protein ABEJ83_02685 [Candidatus Nanohaloarchaea archaeon]